MIEALGLFALAVAAFAIVGIVIGMLVAPRIERLTEPKDEDAGDGID
jgi:hypothetical protein